MPQGRHWLEEATTLYRADVSSSAAPALPYLPHGGREGRCNGHFGGSEGGSMSTRGCKMARTYSDDSDQFGHGGHDAGVLHAIFGVAPPQSRREKSCWAWDQLHQEKHPPTPKDTPNRHLLHPTTAVSIKTRVRNLHMDQGY